MIVTLWWIGTNVLSKVKHLLKLLPMLRRGKANANAALPSPLAPVKRQAPRQPWWNQSHAIVPYGATFLKGNCFYHLSQFLSNPEMLQIWKRHLSWLWNEAQRTLSLQTVHGQGESILEFCRSCFSFFNYQVFVKSDDVVRHFKWHKKRDDSLMLGFLRYTSLDDCSVELPGSMCTHNLKRTHYHCIHVSGFLQNFQVFFIFLKFAAKLWHSLCEYVRASKSCQFTSKSYQYCQRRISAV